MKPMLIFPTWYEVSAIEYFLFIQRGYSLGSIPTHDSGVTLVWLAMYEQTSTRGRYPSPALQSIQVDTLSRLGLESIRI